MLLDLIATWSPFIPWEEIGMVMIPVYLYLVIRSLRRK